MDLVEWDMLDPQPEIHALFLHYNTLYFDDSLGACVVSWSSPRMTSCAGVCHYLLGGGCEIRLSEPLLKFRSTTDLKNTLLHEMIHAFLWVKNKNMDHGDHGPSFQSMMNAINSSSVTDHQKPLGGYNITIYHEFHEEVNNYRVHQWICETCGNLVKRAMNREPSANDCIEHKRDGESCANPSCHWHRHKMLCSGKYKKIAEPPGYKDKRRGSKGELEHNVDKPIGSPRITRHFTRRSRKADGMKDKLDVETSNPITSFFPLVGDVNENSGNSSPSGDASQKELELKAIEQKTYSHVVAPEIPKPVRIVTRKKRKYAHTSSKVGKKCKNEYTVIIEWLDWFADEEEDEEAEPLINKRTERRKKHKLLKSLRGRASEIEAVDVSSVSHTNCTRNGEDKYPDYFDLSSQKNGGNRTSILVEDKMEVHGNPVYVDIEQESASLQEHAEGNLNVEKS